MKSCVNPTPRLRLLATAAAGARFIKPFYPTTSSIISPTITRSNFLYFVISQHSPMSLNSKTIFMDRHYHVISILNC